MKKLIITATVVLAMFSMATTSFAAPVRNAGSGYGGCGGYGYSLMRDTDGSFLSKETFEERLDSYIADGYIREADRDYYVQRYDFCVTNGGGGNFGGCFRR